MKMAIDDDIYSSAVQEDPFAYYGALREHDPVHWNKKYEVWIVTRYEDVVQVARNQAVFSSERSRDKRPPMPPIDPADTAHTSL